MKTISILSVPRSGSSWVGQIFNSAPEVAYRFQPNFAYSFPYELSRDSSKEEIDIFHERLLDCSDPFVNAKISISGEKNIEFPKEELKTLVWKEVHHLFLAETLLKNSDTTVVGLIRSPFAVLASWIQIPKEFDPSWSILEQWKTAPLKNSDSEKRFFGYEKWKEIGLAFLRLQETYPRRIYLLNYDDLLRDRETVVRDLFGFCGIAFTEQTKKFLKQSSKKNEKSAYSVFKAKQSDDQWKDKLPEAIVKEIKEDEAFRVLNKRFKWV